LLERHYQWLLRHGGRKGEGVASGTVRAVNKTLVQAPKFADDRGLDPGHATRMKLPRVERREADAWTPDEARAFLQDTTTERLHALFVLGVHTGMRRGEMAGLRWSDVDLDCRSVAIRRQRAYDGVASESVGPRLTPTGTDRNLYHLDHEHG
jgi:integrase